MLKSGKPYLRWSGTGKNEYFGRNVNCNRGLKMFKKKKNKINIDNIKNLYSKCRDEFY